MLDKIKSSFQIKSLLSIKHLLQAHSSYGVAEFNFHSSIALSDSQKTFAPQPYRKQPTKPPSPRCQDCSLHITLTQ